MILNDPISGSSRVFAIVTSLPAGIPGSAIRYGAVAAQGLTGGGGISCIRSFPLNFSLRYGS